MPVRIKGIDAPEIKGKCDKEKKLAIAAKQFTVAQLRSTKKIELREMKRGKYFRILADMYVDDKNLGAMLIKNGHARAYDGGKRGKWCN